ncbi:MAG: PQQ-binding-like beta-propeller repeat protein [Acidobacteriota bacterium]
MKPSSQHTQSCIVLTAFLFFAGAAGAADAPLDATHQWPMWRGPLGTGVAPHGDPPVTWSEEKNVRWKTPLPGLGHSTPIVWGDKIFLTTAIPHGEELPVKVHEHRDHGAHDNTPASRRQKFVVLAIDRRDGSVLWQREVRDEQPHESAHVTGSWASNSAVTDGRRVYASFGSQGLYSLDFGGKIVWQKDLGDMRVRHEHGEGSSPALYGDTLIVNWDHQGDSFVVALDAATGKERWRQARDEITSWSTPLIVEHAGKAQVVIAATKRVRSYDLATGKELWQASGLSRNVVASPVAGNGMVFVGNSYDWQAMLAIRLDKAKGDITTTDAVAWTRERDTPYVPSPLLFDDTLCFLKHSHGFLTCVEAATGEARLGPVRLPRVRNIFASPVGADDRIYIASREGTTAVVQRGVEFELLAVNALDDSFSASPAVVGDELLLRGQEFLYSLTRQPAPESASN